MTVKTGPPHRDNVLCKSEAWTSTTTTSSRNVAQTVVTNETSKYSICADVLRPRSTENSCCHASQTDLSERGRRLTGTIDVFEIVEASITIRSTSFISGLSINRFRPRLIVPGRWTELCAFFSRRWLASFHVLNRITDRRDRSFGYNNLYSLNMNYVILLPAFVAFSNNDCDYWSLILLSCWKDRGNINLCETVSKGLEECSCSIMKLKFDVNSYTTYNLFTKFFITYNSFPGDKNPPIFRSSSIPLSTRHITSIKGPLESSRSSRWNSFCCHHPTTSPFPRYDGFKDRLNFESSVLSIPVSFSLVPSHSHAPFFRSLALDSFTATLAPLTRYTDLPHCPLTRWVSLFFLSLPSPLSLSRSHFSLSLLRDVRISAKKKWVTPLPGIPCAIQLSARFEATYLGRERNEISMWKKMPLLWQRYFLDIPSGKMEQL